MYLVRHGPVQHEIINGYNNGNKHDKTCSKVHALSPDNSIVLLMQKEVNLEANLLPLVDAFRNRKIELNINLQLLQNFFTDWQLTPSFA